MFTDKRKRKQKRTLIQNSLALAVYLVNECDGAIDLDYAYLFALQRRVTTHAQPCAVLGHKFAHLREAEGERQRDR